ncbi:MAG: DMP19 family protein [Spirochaetaceae bacterium]|jgi:hypothetical protein|nr:DMP19 family protein [Spirochaetaceae bacterium]
MTFLEKLNASKNENPTKQYWDFWERRPYITKKEMGSIPANAMFDAVWPFRTKMVNDLANYLMRDKFEDEALVAFRKMDANLQLVYCVIYFKLDVWNDGLGKMFTGFPCLFLYETLNCLKKIGAIKAYNILQNAIEIVNIKKKSRNDFFKDIRNEEEYLYGDEINEKLNVLGSELYKIEEEEDIQKLLNKYVIENIRLVR